MPDHPLTAQAVADLVGGRLSGNGGQPLSGVAPLDAATEADLSFLASPRYGDSFRRSRAGCVLIGEGILAPAEGPAVRIVVPDPHRALATVLHHLHPSRPRAAGVHPTAQIAAGTQLGAEVSIGPLVVIGHGCRIGDRVRLDAGVVLEDHVTIGAGSVLGPRVVCGEGTQLGARVTIKAGAVIGGVGFGYISDRTGHHRIPHVGGCRIGDDVDIGSNSCVDRGSLGETVIGRGTKLDNLVQVGHNVQIGEDCLLMAGVGVAGSTRIGDRVILAGQAGLVGHLTIGDDARIGAQSGVISSIPAGAEVSGYPARPHREYMRAMGALYRLTPIARRLEALVKDPPADG